MSGITRELPKTLYSAKQAKRIDQAWIRSHPVTGYQLMCRAGLGLWHLMQGSLTAGALEKDEFGVLRTKNPTSPRESPDHSA